MGADKLWEETMEEKRNLESYLKSLKETLDTQGDKFDAEEKEQVLEIVEETSDWLDNLDGEKRNIEDYRAKKEEVEDVAGAIMRSLYGDPPDEDLDEDDDMDDIDEEDEWHE